MQQGVLEKLVEQLEKLPGIGSKTAERLAYHLLKVKPAEALALADAIRRLKEAVRECARCHNITEQQLCSICADPRRDPSVICVVEQPKDLHAIESTGHYAGLYHVLGASYSPIEDRGAEALTLEHLRRRITEEGVQEVILATNPDFEGDGTALLVRQALAVSGVVVSRLARGLPSGSQIEYMNSSILSDALEGRRRLAGADGSGADGPGAGGPGADGSGASSARDPRGGGRPGKAQRPVVAADSARSEASPAAEASAEEPYPERTDP